MDKSLQISKFYNHMIARQSNVLKNSSKLFSNKTKTEKIKFLKMCLVTQVFVFVWYVQIT